MVVCASLALLLGACSSGETQPDQEQPLTQTLDVKAKEGASITLGDGAVLEIPKGALKENTKVTFARACDGIYKSTWFASCNYEVSLGKDVQAKTFSLLLPLRSGSGRVKELSLGARVTDGYRKVNGGRSQKSVENGLLASAQSMQSFAVIKPIEGMEDDQRAVEMAPVDCGGDLVGEWRLIMTTGSMKQATGISRSGPPDPCEPEEHLQDYPFIVSGKLRYEESSCAEADESEECGNPYVYQSSSSSRRHEIITDACMLLVDMSCDQDECSYENGVCECLWFDSEQTGAGSGFWRTEDGLLFENGAQEGTPYCVEGDTLTVQHENEGKYVSVYERVD